MPFAAFDIQETSVTRSMRHIHCFHRSLAAFPGLITQRQVSTSVSFSTRRTMRSTEQAPGLFQGHWKRRFHGDDCWLAKDTTIRSLEFVNSNPLASGEKWGDSELVQLCDLLLGAACDALVLPGRTRKHTGRLRLAQSVTRVLAETLAVPWFQQIPVFRRFSVSLYPDKFNFEYRRGCGTGLLKGKPLHSYDCPNFSWLRPCS
jgi:hypothetical protein